VDVEQEVDPDHRAALQAQIAEFGQTPRQLFASRHPRRGDAPAPPPALLPVPPSPPPPRPPTPSATAAPASANATQPQLPLPRPQAVRVEEQKQQQQLLQQQQQQQPAVGAAAAEEAGAEAGAPGGEAPAEAPAAEAPAAGAPAEAPLQWRAAPMEEPLPALHAPGAHVHALVAPLKGLAHTAGGDGVLLCLGLGVGNPEGGRLRVSVMSRGAPASAPATGASPPAAQLHAALYGDDAALPLRACGADTGGEVPETVWVGGTGGEVHALPVGGALGPGGARPLRLPGGASVGAIAGVTACLGFCAGGVVEDSVTVTFVGASDGTLGAWQWSRDGGGWGAGEPLLSPAPAFERGAVAAPAPPPPVTALAASAPVARAGAVATLLAVGDATGRVRVLCVTVRRAPPGSAVGPIADGGGSRACVEVRPVGGGGSEACVVDPLARGDLFLGGASGVVGGAWCGEGEAQWLATAGSDGRLAAWRAGGAAWWRGGEAGGGAPGGTPLAPAAIVATGEALRAVARAPGEGVVATAGARGTVRTWRLGALAARAPGTAPPLRVPAEEALLDTLPPAAEGGGTPYTAIAVTSLPGQPPGGACVLCGRRDGRLSAWLLG
jgi:hypothetical protein